jgi:hypothetical protein
MTSLNIKRDHLSPKRLMEYAIAHVRSIAFIRSKGTMNNF